MADEEKLLVSMMRAGNGYAFEKLYYKYCKKLYNFVFSIIKNKEDAEGTVQLVFMKVWEKRTEIDPEKSFSGYVFRIAKNNLLNRIKKQINERVYLDYLLSRPEDLSNSVEKNINFLELNLEIERLIKNIPEKRRKIFLLSRMEGLTYREIAEKLNISVNTVNTQISKTLEELRDSMADKVLPALTKADHKSHKE
jgi:RNA polymerase sigma-70 factor (ECF subfamily)